MTSTTSAAKFAICRGLSDPTNLDALRKLVNTAMRIKHVRVRAICQRPTTDSRRGVYRKLLTEMTFHDVYSRRLVVGVIMSSVRRQTICPSVWRSTQPTSSLFQLTNKRLYLCATNRQWIPNFQSINQSWIYIAHKRKASNALYFLDFKL